MKAQYPKIRAELSIPREEFGLTGLQREVAQEYRDSDCPWWMIQGMSFWVPTTGEWITPHFMDVNDQREITFTWVQNRISRKTINLLSVAAEHYPFFSWFIMNGAREVERLSSRPARHDGLLFFPEPNKAEKAFSNTLYWRWNGGEILWYAYEAMRFSLGPGIWYTPDFPCLMPDGRLFIYEHKGRWKGHDNADRLRVRLAARRFPFFVWIAALMQPKKEGGGWKYEEFS